MSTSPKDNTSGVIDLNHLLTLKAQQAMREVQRKQKILLDNSMANHDAIRRVYHADLLLLAAASREEIGEAISTYFPPILDVAAARLVADSQNQVSKDPFVTALPSQMMNALTDDSGVFLGPLNNAQSKAFAAAGIDVPPSAAIVRLPQDMPTPSHDIALLLAGHADHSFTPSHGTELLTQMVMKIAIALAARPLTSK